MKQWYKTRKKDPFYLKAKKNDIISRAYYKLEEIDKKYNLFKNQKKILDVGCSPGGWTQYILKKNPKNKIVGIDLLPIDHQIDGELTFYMMDLNEFDNIDKLFTNNKYTFNSIISDIAPNTSGNQFLDQTNSYNLSLLSAKFIEKYLNKGGSFLVKNFQGEDTEKLFKFIKNYFEKTIYVKPAASDKKSKEIYILGLVKK
tara:strand:+ start:2047 stop:2646 length:600 start_codon:yes stop_codon:yes gene_type:complete